MATPTSAGASTGFTVPTGGNMPSPLASTAPAPSTTAKTGGGGSWGDTQQGFTVPKTSALAGATATGTGNVPAPQTPGTPPTAITAKPAIANAQKQTVAVTQMETAAQQQAAAKAASEKAAADALAAKNAADANKAASGGLTQSDASIKAQEMSNQASIQAYQSKVKAAGDVKTTGTAAAEQPSSSTAQPTDKTPEQAWQDEQAASIKRMDDAYAEHKALEAQIRNGTYPLSADQQAQLDDIKNRFEGLIAQQKIANANYENAVRRAGISAGRNIYAPEVELGNVNAAISAGIAKVSDLNTQMSMSLVKARQAIQSENMEALDSAYKEMTQYEMQRREAITQTYEMAKEAIKTAREDFEMMKQDYADFAAVGKSPDEFDDKFFTAMDNKRQALGLATYEGFSRDLYQVQYDAAQAKTKKATEEAEIKRANDMVSLLDKIGKTGVIEVDGIKYTYQGYNGQDIATGTETDQNGRVKAWSFNKRTGASKSYDLGIMKAEDGWSTMDMGENGVWAVNAKTGESRPFYASQGRQAWDQGQFATGQTGPARAGSANAGQCGAMCNYFYGEGVVGDSLESKLAPLSKYAVGSAEEVRPGMTFVTSEGGSTGHIGFVESVGVDTTSGKERPYITVFESNFHGDGKIDHGRKIYMDDPKLKMISDYPAKNLPTFGSDAQPEILKKTSEKSATPLSVTERKAYQDEGYIVPLGATQADVADFQKAKVADPIKAQKANEVIDLVNQLYDDPNLDWAVGPISHNWTPTLRGGSADFEANANRLKSLLTMENMGIMKGVLSDSDMKLISSAASALDLGMSEQGFRNELLKIKTKMEDRLGNPASSSSALPDIDPPNGEIWVMDKNGTVGSVPMGEYDPNIYVKL